MPTTTDKGFYDSTLDPHGVLMNISEEGRCRFLRAYINARLLFFPQLYLTDATINNNGALRQLILSNERQDIVCDYEELIKEGSIIATVRDKLPLENFSSELRKIQERNKHTNLPSEEYTRKIDNLFNEKYGNIIEFKLEDVSKRFTDKVKCFLEDDYSINYAINDRMQMSNVNNWDQTGNLNGLLKNSNIVRVKLLEEINWAQTVDLNGLLTKIENYGYKKEYLVYELFKTKLSECYNNNIPESLNLNYQTMVSELLLNIDEHESVFKHEVPQRYVYNIDCLANLPSKALIEAKNLPQRDKFNAEFNKYQIGNTKSENALFSSFENYIKELDYFIKNNLTEAIKTEMKNHEERLIEIRNKTYKRLDGITDFSILIGLISSLSFVSDEIPKDVPAIIAISSLIAKKGGRKIIDNIFDEKIKCKKELFGNKAFEFSHKSVIMSAK